MISSALEVRTFKPRTLGERLLIRYVMNHSSYESQFIQIYYARYPRGRLESLTAIVVQSLITPVKVLNARAPSPCGAAGDRWLRDLAFGQSTGVYTRSL